MIKKLSLQVRFATFVLFILNGLSVAGQGNKPLPPGFPDRSPQLDVLPGFKKSAQRLWRGFVLLVDWRYLNQRTHKLATRSVKKQQYHRLAN